MVHVCSIHMPNMPDSSYKMTTTATTMIIMTMVNELAATATTAATSSTHQLMVCVYSVLLCSNMYKNGQSVRVHSSILYDRCALSFGGIVVFDNANKHKYTLTHIHGWCNKWKILFFLHSVFFLSSSHYIWKWYINSAAIFHWFRWISIRPWPCFHRPCEPRMRERGKAHP